MTTYNSLETQFIPREITFSNLELPAKRAVSIIFEDGTLRAVTFYFTHIEYSNEQLVEIYWWEGETKEIGFYGIIEALYPIDVKNPATDLTEFIVLPRSTNIEEVVNEGIKIIKMSPRLWVYEVDGL